MKRALWYGEGVVHTAWWVGGFLVVISRDYDHLSLFANNKVTSEDFGPHL